MEYDVLVAGGGIGGLTVAALLAARGLSVCLFERQSRPGGCVANFDHLGYEFEPTAGLYSGWEPRGIYERIFSELRAKPPEVRQLTPSYVVRLPDKVEIAVSADPAQFEAELRNAFPECVKAAADFYRELAQIGSTSTSSAELTTAHLAQCSPRFRSFIDVQLQTLTQCGAEFLSYARAAAALTAPLRGMWAIRGGAQSLADALAHSVKQSGGRLRLDSPVLRLAFGSDGSPIGIDLLSGERVLAKQAVVSNLTVWDTYGKLIGPGRTPAAVSSQLKKLNAWGTYLLFLGMDQATASQLRANTTLVLNDSDEREHEPNQTQLVFAAAPLWDCRAPEDKVAVTVTTWTQAEDWFSFHDDETSHERQDQSAMEALWTRLHQAMPELGDGVEVIETSTPRALYETTRRKFGMTGKLCPSPSGLFTSPRFGTTVFPNVFLVGDTACESWGLEGICRSAIDLADVLSSRQ